MSSKHEHHYTILKTTCDCNLSCKYCFDKPLRHKYAGQKMSKEIIDKVLKLESEYAHTVTLDLFGGEPTTQSQDYYRELVELTNNYYETNFQFVMQSNGVIPSKDPTWVDLCEELGIGLNFSYDLGTQYLRGNGVNEEGLRSVIRELRKRGVSNGGIISVLNNKNIGDAIAIYEQAKIDTDLIPIFNLMSTSYNKGQVGLEINSDYYAQLEKYVLHVLKDKDTVISALERASSQYIAILLFLERVIVCDTKNCTKLWINVMPDGSISCCSKPSAKLIENYNIGNVKDYDSIDEMYESAQYLHYIADIEYRYETYCNKCNFQYYCMGNCHTQHSHAHDGSVRHVNESICSNMKGNILNAYKWSLMFDIDEEINPNLVSELIRYGKFMPKELEDMLKRANLVSDKFTLYINVDLYADTPDDFIANPRHLLFKLLNLPLEGLLTDIRHPKLYTLESSTTYKQSIFDDRLKEHYDEVIKLIHTIESED